MSLRARWREAAQQAVPVYAMGTCPWTYVDLRNAADAAVRVVLEHLLSEASEGGNLDDGLWCERLGALLKEMPGSESSTAPDATRWTLLRTTVYGVWEHDWDRSELIGLYWTREEAKAKATSGPRTQRTGAARWGVEEHVIPGPPPGEEPD